MCALRDKFVHISSINRPRSNKFLFLNHLLRRDGRGQKAISRHSPFNEWRVVNIKCPILTDEDANAKFSHTNYKSDYRESEDKTCLKYLHLVRSAALRVFTDSVGTLKIWGIPLFFNKVRRNSANTICACSSKFEQICSESAWRVSSF